MERFSFKTVDNKILSVAKWEDAETPKGVVLISHGMSEHIERYDTFAKFLNKNGYIVLGADQRAHGLTDQDNLGLAEKGKNLFDDSIRDLSELTDLAFRTYKLPVFLFGHSYGSFLSQGFLLDYSYKIKGCILCGSAFYNTLTAGFGKFVADIACLTRKNKGGKFFASITFGGYDKKIKEGLNGWLSCNTESNEKYNNDKMCGFLCSNGFYKYFFGGLKHISKADFSVINSKLPIKLIYGSEDYVGGCGKLVKQLFNKYSDAGLNVSINEYEGMRHEILNEKDNKKVFQDIVDFYNQIK